MASKLVVVTGSNRGIGLEFIRQFKQRGCTVIAACRRSSKELSAMEGVEVVEGVDVGLDEGTRPLVEALTGRAVDIIVNNSGILTREGLDDLDFANIRRQFEVNSIGPLRVTVALRANLMPGSKVAIITSRMGSIADNGSGGRYGYRMSKAAVNAAGKTLALDLKSAGVAVAILHPGWVRTDMTEGEGLVDPPESVRGLIDRIDGLTLENTGTFWHMNGEVLPW